MGPLHFNCVVDICNVITYRCIPMIFSICRRGNVHYTLHYLCHQHNYLCNSFRTSMQDGESVGVPTAGRVLQQESPWQGDRRQPETGTIVLIKLIDTCKLMKLLRTSISFRSFRSFRPETMMGSSKYGMTTGTHHCCNGLSPCCLLDRSSWPSQLQRPRSHRLGR
jgi:hypothetical protein